MRKAMRQECGSGWTAATPLSWRALSGVLLIAGALLVDAPARAQETGKDIFQQRCAACHTIGKGRLVGPDLAGVTTRREEGWLHRKIREPDRLVAEKDVVTMQLLRESNNIAMAPLGLGEADVASVVGFLKAVDAKGAAAQEIGRHSYFLPTLLVALALLVVLTFAGLRAGDKKTAV